MRQWCKRCGARYHARMIAGPSWLARIWDTYYRAICNPCWSVISTDPFVSDTETTDVNVHDFRPCFMYSAEQLDNMLDDPETAQADGEFTCPWSRTYHYLRLVMTDPWILDQDCGEALHNSRPFNSYAEFTSAQVVLPLLFGNIITDPAIADDFAFLDAKEYGFQWE